MVTQPSCSSELEFPRVNLLAMDSFALQMIGFDEYEKSKQIMMLENIKIARIFLSLNETILKLMETHDAFMIVCPKRYSCVCPGETLTAPSGTNIHVCIKILLLYAKVNDLSKPAHDNLLQRYVSN